MKTIITISLVIIGISCIMPIVGDIPPHEEKTIDDLIDFVMNDPTDQHEYEFDGYNCINFSYALVENLTRAGFDCEYVLMIPIIQDNHRCPHLLVRVNGIKRDADIVIEPINDEMSESGIFELNSFQKGFVVEYIDSYP